MKKITINKTILIITIFFAFIFTGCNNTILPLRIPTKDPKIPENGIEKEIPTYKNTNNKIFVYYKYTKQKQDQLKLSIPENGYDSLMLRIWFTYPSGLYQFGELLEINFQKNTEPTAKYTRMDIFFNPTRDFENINYRIDSIISIPKEGWDNFTQIIESYQITKLPTIENIPEYNLRNKESNGYDYKNNYMTVAIEVSTPTKYRFIQYNNFIKYQDIKEVGEMYSFIQYLRKNFYMNEVDPQWYGSLE